jgi:F-type H+-transporting ATPase subunit delta
MNRAKRSSDAVVYSAFPIERRALDELAAALEKRFGRKLNVSGRTEPELIGGVRVVVGDEVLDTSVKARLGTNESRADCLSRQLSADQP